MKNVADTKIFPNLLHVNQLVLSACEDHSGAFISKIRAAEKVRCQDTHGHGGVPLSSLSSYSAHPSTSFSGSGTSTFQKKSLLFSAHLEEVNMYMSFVDTNSIVKP